MRRARCSACLSLAPLTPPCSLSSPSWTYVLPFCFLPCPVLPSSEAPCAAFYCVTCSAFCCAPCAACCCALCSLLLCPLRCLLLCPIAPITMTHVLPSAVPHSSIGVIAPPEWRSELNPYNLADVLMFLVPAYRDLSNGTTTLMHKTCCSGEARLVLHVPSS